METETPNTPTKDQRLELAQNAFRDYSTQCFWFMDEKMIVTEETLPQIIEGLKLHGGHKGWKLAHELCR